MQVGDHDSIKLLDAIAIAAVVKPSCRSTSGGMSRPTSR
jgi:hypothetical protein